MFDFIETGRAIQILYQYAKAEILESDFLDLPAEAYKTLLESEKELNWYMLNPAKLNKNYFAQQSAFIVNEREKSSLLKAVQFIDTTTARLPIETSFLERLLYTKKSIPPCFFPSVKATSNDKNRIIPFKH